jgi:hypothetical protein
MFFFTPVCCYKCSCFIYVIRGYLRILEDNTMAKRKSAKGQITIYKTKDRVTRTPLKTGGELRSSGKVGSSCSTSGTHRVNLVTNPMRKGPVYDKWNIYIYIRCHL